MRMIFAVLCALACVDSLAQQPERPSAKQMPAIRQKQVLSAAEKRRQWQNEVHDRYMNREWFVELADEFGKTGLPPKHKQLPGICLHFIVASTEEELRRAISREASKNCLGVIHKEVRRRGNKLLAVTMWIDEDVVDWPFDGGNWSSSGR